MVDPHRDAPGFRRVGRSGSASVDPIRNVPFGIRTSTMPSESTSTVPAGKALSAGLEIEGGTASGRSGDESLHLANLVRRRRRDRGPLGGRRDHLLLPRLWAAAAPCPGVEAIEGLLLLERVARKPPIARSAAAVTTQGR